MDTLSDVLRAVRLTGAVFFDVKAASPWVAETPPARQLAGLMRGAEHVIEYHVITRGECWGGLVGEAPTHLVAGDVVAFPQGDAHILSSAPGMRAPRGAALSSGADSIPFSVVMARTADPDTQLPLKLRAGGDCDDGGTHVVCGFLACDARPFNPLLAALPRMLHVRDRPGSDDGWLSRFVHVALAESTEPRAGGATVLARLSELMFVELVRRHIDAMPPGQTGWLAGLRDEHVGRALGLLHARPAHPWTLDQLAREANLSRSALAERFTHLVGQPPMQYLAHWRMQLAAGLLAAGADKVAGVALRVGYDSEAAFSRAFRRLVGVPPATWRRARLAES